MTSQIQGEHTPGSSVIQAYKRVKDQDKKLFKLNAIQKVAQSQSLQDRLANKTPVFVTNAPQNVSQFQKLITGDLTDLIKREILKSNYEQLVHKFKDSSDLWTDPDFPPNQKSWGSPQKVIWKRVQQIIPKPKFVENNFSPSDILQGKIGNCYFLSAVAGLAEKPYRIKRLFPNEDFNKNGIYMAKILHNGVFQQVVVDDYFPCDQEGQLMGSLPAGGNEIWVMVLQKCWAKLFGSYDAIDGGLPHQVLRAFSNAPTYNYRVTKDKSDLETLWGAVLNAQKKDYIICCGTEPDSQKENLQEIGLVGGHAYTILGIYQLSHRRLLKIRNPWGSMEWSGRACDKDKKFWEKISPEQQLNIGFNTGEDGVFFMLWQDFQLYFIIVDICLVDDNAHYFYMSKTYEKDKPYCYQLTMPQSGDITLAVSQKSKRQLRVNTNKNVKLANAILIVAKSDEQYTDFTYITSKSDSAFSDLYLSCKNMQSGKYILCVYVQGEQQINDSTISVYSQPNVTLTDSNINNDQFFHKLFINHARANTDGHQVLCPNPPEWACFQLMSDGCGFGYSFFHLDVNSSKKLGLQFDESQYDNNGLELLSPFKGAGNFKLSCNAGQQVIVLCRLKIGVYIQQFTMPTPKICKLI